MIRRTGTGHPFLVMTFFLTICLLISMVVTADEQTQPGSTSLPPMVSQVTLPDFPVPGGDTGDWKAGSLTQTDQSRLLGKRYGAGDVHTEDLTESYEFVTKWGTYGTGNGQFSDPFGVAVDKSGNVFVADRENNRIQKFDNEGTYITQWGTPGTGNGEFSHTSEVAVDDFGNVFVTDFNNRRIQKFDNEGTYITQWGTSGSGNGQFSYPHGVVVDKSGNVFVADSNNHRIQKFDNEGTYITQWGTPGTGNGQFNYPCGVAVDQEGNVYVADTENNRIQKFDAARTYITQWGTSGGGNGQFNRPYGVAVDQEGNVYVADTENNRIQKIDNEGTFITQWGTQGTGNGQITFPAGVAVDNQGNIFVADTSNKRIQRFRPAVSLSAVSPSSGPDTGDTWMKITGMKFLDGARVNLSKPGEENITADVVISSSYILCNLPLTGRAPGSWNVTVTNRNGAAGTLPAGFTITATRPTVSLISPRTGTSTGNLAATVTGTNFQIGVRVNLTRTGYTAIPSIGVSVASSSRLVCTLPITGKAAGTWNVQVTNPDGQSGTLTNGFIITGPAPVITKITPNTGPRTKNIAVTITGKNFRPGATVKISKGAVTKNAVAVKRISGAKITATLPVKNLAPGWWKLTVRNTDGTSGMKANGFQVKARADGESIAETPTGPVSSPARQVVLHPGVINQETMPRHTGPAPIIAPPPVLG